ncbi:conserved hypothetical protein [Gluconacetobacter diazotrophicus PA1 5]|uniref:DUF2474 domain-containing protein n=2 Tax=Gluconacetobacter diazotrophicus TaxID=33996 RepID=A0A7W4I3G0_GLUDI|nr:DUF2474 domain-containing protein [Gluconacetobacter diazotrophicus]ACI51253.1 conserved hypothetical protein [Gluconacetobacter diazotrophicus PA1 5]MBB2155043.1 DUF2474 domain-containing protein [Gluconacetobacter diazotrophicus]TWB09801.1 uncharacterized protein DUF2474 [Gluconacetobacter diazotrophicus]CAP54476.1 putative membrane protein [Gluconacetobacter diazotrophicus PA1 5]
MPPWTRRLGWMAVIWTASVLALGVFAMLMHLLMAAAGMAG